MAYRYLPAWQARRRGIPADSIRRAETSDRSRGPKDVIYPEQSVTHCHRALPAKKAALPGGFLVRIIRYWFQRQPWGRRI